MVPIMRRRLHPLVVDPGALLCGMESSGWIAAEECNQPSDITNPDDEAEKGSTNPSQRRREQPDQPKRVDLVHADDWDRLFHPPHNSSVAGGGCCGLLLERAPGHHLTE